VKANSHVPSLHGTDQNGASYSDMFRGGTGSHIHASARFYEGLQLPSSFKVQPAGFSGRHFARHNDKSQPFNTECDGPKHSLVA